jgi:hypothetical protein
MQREEMTPMKSLIAILMLGTLATQVSAGTVQCRFADGNGQFIFNASFDDNGKTGLVAINGRLASPSIKAKPGVSSLAIAAAHVHAQAFDRNGAYLKLRFPASVTVASDVMLDIAARRTKAEGIVYVGNYMLAIAPAVEADNVAYSGTATCGIK